MINLIFFNKKISKLIYECKKIKSSNIEMHEKISLTLDPATAKKLISGKNVNLSAGALRGNRHHIVVHPSTAAKIKKAMRSGKGVRICLTADEVDMSGQGLKEFLQKAKDVGKKIKEKIIDTDIYQKAIKPLVRKAVDSGVNAVSPYLGPLAPYAKRGVDKLGQISNAYGVKGGNLRYYNMLDLPSVLSSNHYVLLAPVHPAMRPTMANLPDPGESDSDYEEEQWEERQIETVNPVKRTKMLKKMKAGSAKKRMSGSSFKPSGY